MIGFFEWPSVEQRTAFEGDPRFRRIKGIRDDALSFLTVGYFKVESDTSVTFQALLRFSRWFSIKSSVS